MTTRRYGYENSWTLGTCTKEIDYENHQRYTESCCLNPGSYQLTCDDSYGDGWHGGFIEMEGKRYCEKFVTGHQQVHTIHISLSTGNYFSQIRSEMKYYIYSYYIISKFFSCCLSAISHIQQTKQK